MGDSVFSQAGHAVRFDWGLEGLRATAQDAEAVVVVDVLSFASAVDVAVSRGAAVMPCTWRTQEAAELARHHGALLAVGRRQVSPDAPYSLSPASLEGLTPGSRLVLASPNGATICAAARQHAPGARVLAGCLRNAAAVAAVLAHRGGTVTVVAAGEQWPDGALRPALEDLLGAGAVIDRLCRLDPTRSLSAEARGARAAFVGTDVATDLPRCASALELSAAGFGQDVAVASALDASTAAPAMTPEGWLVDQAGVPADRHRGTAHPPLRPGGG